MELILIEGLPGSGKSTLAEQLCDFARVNDIQSTWYLEESNDHPVHPIKFRSEKHKPSFPEHCLKQWQRFISNNKDNDQLFILEGSLFQSTVRFMMEANNETMVTDYFKECEDILSEVSPKLIYLRPPRLQQHIDWVMNHRGEQWNSKVTKYLEVTPYCSKRGLNGADCMHSFWSDYAQLCDVLVSKSTMLAQTIKVDNDIFEYHLEEMLMSFDLNCS